MNSCVSSCIALRTLGRPVSLGGIEEATLAYEPHSQGLVTVRLFSSGREGRVVRAGAVLARALAGRRVLGRGEVADPDAAPAPAALRGR